MLTVAGSCVVGHQTLEAREGTVSVVTHAKGTAKYLLPGGQDRGVRLRYPNIETEILGNRLRSRFGIFGISDYGETIRTHKRGDVRWRWIRWAVSPAIEVTY